MRDFDLGILFFFILKIGGSVKFTMIWNLPCYPFNEGIYRDGSASCCVGKLTRG